MSIGVNPRYKPMVYLGVAATVLAAGAVFAPWESAKIIGLTVLTGVGYGIANNMIGCRECIEFYTVGQKFGGDRLISSKNPNLNALVWGIVGSWHVSALAGSILAFVARTPFEGYKLKITSAQLLPYFIIGAVTTFVLAHLSSRSARQIMEERVQEPDEMVDTDWRVTNRSYFYENVPDDFQARWAACQTRNATGYAAIFLGGIALTIAILAAKTEKIRWHSLLTP